MTEISFTIPLSPYVFYWLFGWLCFVPTVALAQLLGRMTSRVAKRLSNTVVKKK